MMVALGDNDTSSNVINASYGSGRNKKKEEYN